MHISSPCCRTIGTVVVLVIVRCMYLPFPLQYPVANVDVIMARLRTLTEGKKDDFMTPDTPPVSDYIGLHAIIMSMTGGQVTDHEVCRLSSLRLCKVKTILKFQKSKIKLDIAHITPIDPNFFFGNPSLTFTEHSNRNN